MAGGAVALEAWLSRVLRSAFAAVIMISGAVGAPISMPLLPVHSFIVYQRWLGLQPSTGERVKLGALPQYFADMFGWRELAEVVGKAYAALPPEERKRAVFFGRNYGEAAAVDVLAPHGTCRRPLARTNRISSGVRGSRRQRDVGVRCAGTGTAEPLRLGRAGRLARQPI